MPGLWLSDADVGIRELYAELVPGCLLLSDDELLERLDAGERPSGLIVDGLTLQRMTPDMLDVLRALPRLAVCTGRAADVAELVTGTETSVRLLAKPFSLDDFDALLRWLSEAATTARPP